MSGSDDYDAAKPQREACLSAPFGPILELILQTGRRSNINSAHKLVSTFQLLTFGAVGMAGVLALLPAGGHDQLWFLLMAERWLHGAALYGPEAFDSNPPAIVWLSAIPVALAEGLHLSVPLAAKLMMMMLEGAIAAFSLRVIESFPVRLSSAARWYLAFAFVTLFAVAPARDFGQRDLIAALLCLPYIVAAAQPTSSWAVRVWMVLLAGVGVCAKPQIALIPIAVEVAALLLIGGGSGRRRLRFEPLLLVAVGALFMAAIHLFAPLYFSQALPTTLLTYWAIGHLTFAQLLMESIQLHVLLAVVVFLLPVVLRTRSEAAASIRRAVLMLVVAGLAGVAAYYQQGTGWYYQQLPGITLLGAALSLELLVLAEDWPVAVPNWLPGAAGGLSVLAVALTLHFSGCPVTEERAYAIRSPDPSFFVGLAPGTSVATLTTSVDDAIEPMFRYHLTWAQRTDNLWTLPAILRASQPTALVPRPRRLSDTALALLVVQQRRWMVEDLVRWKPQLILVARCQSPEVHCQELEDRHDDLLGFFLADPAFRAIWQQYRPLRSEGDYDAYTRAIPTAPLSGR